MNTIDRREFFKLTALATGGFVLSVGAQTTAEEASFSPNAFIKITSDGKISLTAHVPDIGQGVKTSLPMIIAEELEVPWERVEVVTEAVNEKIFGKQAAGGSQSIRRNYDQLRRLGAAAKEMLVLAAAKEWNVPKNKCIAQNAQVSYNKKVLTYGELAVKASKQKKPNPKSVKLKRPEDFKVLGKRIGGVDNEAIVTGKPLYGIDQVLENLHYASYTRCPSFNGKVKSANLDQVKSLPGVHDAFILRGSPVPLGGLYEGVAVVADSTWNAKKASEALKIKWDTPDQSKHNTDNYHTLAKEAVKEDRRKDEEGFVEAFYHYPFLAHNTMEPQNTTALFKDGKLELWAPTQIPGGLQGSIQKALKIKPDAITINLTRSGGGFGRRINSDFGVEAAAIAKHLKGIPIKLTWTREQDIQQDYYRNACWHLLQAKVEGSEIRTFSDHVVTTGANSKKPGIGGKMGSNMFPFPFLKNTSVKQSVIPTNLPFGWWRAPGSNGFAFAMQCFFDELAHEAKIDPLDFRRQLLKKKAKGKYDAKRMSGVLEAVAKKADWGKTLPKGSAQGVAFYFSHQGFAAIIAEVTVSQDGKLKVDKLSAAMDVGPIVNLSGAENQVEGSMLDGLSSAWYQEIKIKDGAVQNSNFHDYPTLRMPDVGELDVTFIESDNPPTGLGEPALPPVIPAVCNAIFSASGHRVRTLPINGNVC